MAFGRDDLTRWVNRWWGLIWTFGGTLVSIAVICAVNMVLGACCKSPRAREIHRIGSRKPSK